MTEVNLLTDKCKAMKYSLYILGFVFVAVVSICSAMTINSPLLQLLLFFSGGISLALGVSTMIDSKQANDKINELEKKSQNAVYLGPIVGKAPEIDKLYIDPSKNE